MLDVITIGAGLAGLAAAAECEARGRTVLVLEASSRVGGRVKTEIISGMAVDLGAEWIIPDMHHSIMALMQRGGLNLSWETSTLPAQWTIGGQNRFETYTSLKQTHAAFAQALKTIEQDAQCFSVDGTLKPDISIRHYLNDITSHETASLLEAAIFPLTGGAPDTVSNHMLWQEIIDHNCSIDETLNAKACRIHQGCDALAKVIQSNLKTDIAFNHHVSHIAWAKDHCEVTCADVTLKCRNLICAIPLTTLNAITFDPPLPHAMLETAEHSNAGRVAKVWAHCKSKAPLRETLNDKSPLRYGYARNIDENHWLVCGQVLADDGAAFTPEDAAPMILSNWPEVEVISISVTDWPREPLARASWHSSRVKWSTRTKAFQTSIGPLHFAGGDIASKWAGWMEGALLSGKQVALNICNS